MSRGRLGAAIRRERASLPKSGPMAAIPKRGKYGNRKTVCRHDHRHDSKKEALRCDELHILEAGGAIEHLILQPPFFIGVNGVEICKYVADFAYIDNGKRIVEDVKGMRTATYRIKRKLMKAIYGIEVLET